MEMFAMAGPVISAACEAAGASVRHEAVRIVKCDERQKYGKES